MQSRILFSFLFSFVHATFCLANVQADKITSPTAQCCNRLLAKLGSASVLYSNSTLYNQSASSYWASQELENRPRCIVVAQTAHDVSVTVRTVRRSLCPLAIKAGGHGKWSASASSNGIVLDLSSMKTVNVSVDRQSVSVGAGAKWRDVYAALDPQGLTVAGARSADVGVGGLSLAGGLSYFNPRVGLTTNTLLDVEIVLASGEIVHTSADRYRDLDKAIRGGTNNFGVATRFTFQAVPFFGAWGGDIYYPLGTANTQLQTLQEFASDPQYDPFATATLSFGVEAAGGAAVANIVYTSPITSVPATLHPFTNITSLFDTLRAVNMSDITEEIARGSPAGFRQATYTLTLHNDLPTMLAAYKLWNASYPLLTNVSGITYSFTLEPLPPAALSKTGNDITGLAESAGEPLHIYLLSASWSDAADDQLVLSTASCLLNDVKSHAKQAGTLHPFLYAGYADRSQPVYADSASDDYAFAKKISRKVDPTRVFQKQVEGGFKFVNLEP